MSEVRIAAHVHSTWSYDGEWSLAELADAFRWWGYDIVLMAEHDRTFDQHRWDEYRHACAALSDDELLLVPGIEYEDADNVVHVPVWGSTAFLGSGRPTLEVLRAAAEHSAAVVFAHPLRRRAITRFAPDWSPLLHGVEIWNRKFNGVAPCAVSRRLAQSTELTQFVSLDFHNRRQFFPLAMTATLTEPLSTAAIVHAIRDGRCRPEFLGTSAMRFTHGPGAVSVNALERVRRGMRRPVRALSARRS